MDRDAGAESSIVAIIIVSVLMVLAAFYVGLDTPRLDPPCESASGDVYVNVKHHE